MAQAVMKVLHAVSVEYPDELKKEIFEAVGDLSDFEIWGQEILVAPFIRSPISKGGLIIPGTDSGAIDDQYQSKSFLILKFGIEAAEISLKGRGGRNPQVGEWCWTADVQAGRQLNLCGNGSKMKKGQGDQNYRTFTGWPCRLMLIGDIGGRTKRPQDVM